MKTIVFMLLWPGIGLVILYSIVDLITSLRYRYIENVMTLASPGPARKPVICRLFAQCRAGEVSLKTTKGSRSKHVVIKSHVKNFAKAGGLRTFFLGCARNGKGMRVTFFEFNIKEAIMIRRLVLSTGIIAVLAGHALAADLPSRSSPPVFVAPPVNVFVWTGLYAGVSAGYAFDYDDRINTFNGSGNATGVPALRPPFSLLQANGFTGGGQIGYNYQFAGTGIVAGLEADAAYTGLKQTVAPVLGSGPSVLANRLDFLGTARGRLGYAFDRFLVYGTGGFAYGSVTDSANFFNVGGVALYSGNSSTLRTGYVFGGGVEYAMPTDNFLNFFHSSAVTLKVEFLRYDLGTRSLNVPVTTAGLNLGATGNYTQTLRTDGNLVRAGLNYKFDFSGDSIPVVAKY